MGIGNAFVTTLVLTVFWILSVVEWFIIIWVILSWIVFFMSRSSFRWKHRKFYETLALLNEFLNRATRPMLKPFRRILPPYKTGGIDFSPILLFLVIYMIRTFLRLAFLQGRAIL